MLIDSEYKGSEGPTNLRNLEKIKMRVPLFLLGVASSSSEAICERTGVQKYACQGQDGCPGSHTMTEAFSIFWTIIVEIRSC